MKKILEGKILLLSVICWLIVANVFAQDKLLPVLKNSELATFSIAAYDVNGKIITKGKGFFTDAIGTAISNYHIFEDSGRIEATTSDGNTYQLKEVIVYSKLADIIKFRVDNSKNVILPFLNFSEYRPVQGKPAYLFDKSKEKNYIEGIVSTVRMVENAGLVLLTTVPIRESHDGMPLLNNKGEAIGIVSFPLIRKFDMNLTLSVENFARLEKKKALEESVIDTVAAELEAKLIAEKKAEFGEYYDSIRKCELSLQNLGDSIIDGSNMFVSIDAVTDFIPELVKALKIPNSFNYSFDSLKFLTILKPQDNSFRLFNWTLELDDGGYRYYGAIQMNNPNELKLTPLYDKSDKMMDRVEESILTNESWYGAQYFDIVQLKHKGQKYYILLGWDGNNYISDKKIIEVLSFKDSNIVLGAPIFKSDQKTSRIINRKVFEYRSDAIMILKYEPEKKLISFDHLVPPDQKSNGKPWTYIPDGSYDYYKIKKGKLVFTEGLFEKTKEPNMYKQK